MIEQNKDDGIEQLVETIMRMYYAGSYEQYNNEEIRDYWRKKVRCEEYETMVQQQPGRGEGDR